MDETDVYATLGSFKNGQRVKITFYGYKDMDGDVSTSPDYDSSATQYIDRSKLAAFEVESIEPVGRDWKPGDVVLTDGGQTLVRREQGHRQHWKAAVNGATLSDDEVDEPTLVLVVRDGKKV